MNFFLFQFDSLIYKIKFLFINKILSEFNKIKYIYSKYFLCKKYIINKKPLLINLLKVINLRMSQTIHRLNLILYKFKFKKKNAKTNWSNSL